jgi:hypothetical protein
LSFGWLRGGREHLAVAVSAVAGAKSAMEGGEQPRFIFGRNQASRFEPNELGSVRLGLLRAGDAGAA